MSDHELIHSRYQIENKVAGKQGAFTYAAYDQELKKRVIIKELQFQELDEWKSLELFEREGKTLANLDHPAIPKFIDFFKKEEHKLYLVSELIDGQSLEQKLNEGWRPTENEVIDLSEQLLNILIYLHALNPPVIHRDIKPSNIVLNSQGKLFLIDFGAVTHQFRTEGNRTVAGTFGYMAPEQFAGQAVPASDLYGWGATVVHLLSGKSPTEMPQKEYRLEFESYINCRAPLKHWLTRLIEPDLKQRYADAQLALQDLLNVKSGKKIAQSVGQKLVKKNQTRGYVFLGLGLSLLAVSVAGTIIFSGDVEPTDKCFPGGLNIQQAEQSTDAKEFRQNFQSKFPLPESLKKLDSPRVGSYSELMLFWRCKEKKPQQFFKTSYQAILDFPTSDELVVESINLMYYDYRAYPQMLELQTFAVDNYFDHKTSVASYNGKNGDHLAGVVENLGQLYLQKSDYQSLITLHRRLLAERETDINDHLLQLISYQLAKALWKSNESEEALQVLNHALKMYVEGSWKKKLNKLKRDIESTLE